MAAPTQPKVVLITGCSSGIGRAAADLLARRGHVVWATARREESLRELASWAHPFGDRVHLCRLDVTDAASLEAAVGDVLEQRGRIDALVNNAGFGQLGAVEDVSLAQWRAQMETNLFGAVALTRAVLPAMRARGAGRIINISSVVAHAALPMMAPYCASKHALDAFSMALRGEVSQFGIHVVAIEPGPTSTEFRGAAEKASARTDQVETGPYARAYRAFARHWTVSYKRGVGQPADVAQRICHAVEANKPRARYRLGAVAKTAPLVLAMTPVWVLDWITRRLLASGQERS